MNKVFPYNEEVETLLNKAKKYFHLSMNGIAAEKMASLGYKLNYGVPIMRIKEISAEFPSNPLFVEHAWWSGCRELMILASFLLEKDMNKNDLQKDKIEEFASQLFNIELCEQFSKNFLSKISYIDNQGNDRSCQKSQEVSKLLISRREQSNSKYLIATGYINLANLLLTKAEYDSQFDESIQPYILKDAHDNSYVIYNSLSSFLRIKARKYPKEMEQFIQQLDLSKGSSVRYIFEEVNTELKYGTI